ncbi:hypothetical protein CVT24_008659 [Panaeolus cyanescens]|uniref:Uncharacterized protein n=1 Tax=Panaeolus cyanescens TaxID=181874 RepID=A0A409VDR4_9AGAR|nr:hypothetical protein CVT24_008659 [Panaeolus cyanescens]
MEPIDLPDLYYDHGLPTPPSATSSNMIPTPPQDSHSTWFQESPSSNTLINPPYPLSSWHSSPLNSCQARPTVTAIDTNFNSKHHAKADSNPSSTMFVACEDFDVTRMIHPQFTSVYPHSSEAHNVIHCLPPSSFIQKPVHSNIQPNSSQSSSSSPINIPPTKPGPLKVHQPRPSRQIPIVSLSQLASACEDYPINGRASKPTKVISPPEIDLSPLPLESNGFLPPMSSHSKPYHSTNQQTKYASHPPNNAYNPTFSTGTHGNSIMCSCGCMETYTFS